MSLDTAFSEKEAADYSAVTLWGIFKHTDPASGERVRNMMLLGAQKGRWDFPELRRRTEGFYHEWQPDTILIEKKASGQSLIQELRLAGLPVLDWQPDKDKISRAYACQPIFEAGRIWAPNKSWADDVMYECSSFPAGKNDDYVDAMTHAVLWMKGGRWIVNPEDDYEELDEDETPTQARFYW